MNKEQRRGRHLANRLVRLVGDGVRPTASSMAEKVGGNFTPEEIAEALDSRPVRAALRFLAIRQRGIKIPEGAR